MLLLLLLSLSHYTNDAFSTTKIINYLFLTDKSTQIIYHYERYCYLFIWFLINLILRHCDYNVLKYFFYFVFKI